MGDTVTTADMHFDTFSLYSSTLRADISAPVNPRGLKLTLLESEDSSDSSQMYYFYSRIQLLRFLALRLTHGDRRLSRYWSN